VFQRLPKLLVALALAGSVGLHWSLLQSLAWTTMLADNLATESFSVAVQRTFDGKHPCALCKAIAKGKKSEKKADTLSSLRKFEAWTQAAAALAAPPAAFPAVPAQAALFESLAQTPPTPPPRAA